MPTMPFNSVQNQQKHYPKNKAKQNLKEPKASVLISIKQVGIIYNYPTILLISSYSSSKVLKLQPLMFLPYQTRRLVHNDNSDNCTPGIKTRVKTDGLSRHFHTTRISTSIHKSKYLHRLSSHAGLCLQVQCLHAENMTQYRSLSFQLINPRQTVKQIHK